MDINIISGFWPGWEIEEEIGRGAFGSVYKARHSEYGETFYRAIKHMTIPQNPYSLKSLYAEGMDETSVTMFYQKIVNDCVNEIKVMERLKGHSNIVNVDDFKVVRRPGEARWDIFIRMELLLNLTDYMKGKRFSQQEVRKIGMDLCAGLIRCEKEHVIHRDIKPENVFVSRAGDYKLGDFGIARKIEGAAEEMSQKGTVGFMAPEVYFGKAYDQRVDIYSLGLLLYLLLNNNRMPFLDPDAPTISFQEREDATKYRLRGEVLPRPCDADPTMAKIILKACSFDPDDRYYSADEMLGALTEMKAEKASIFDSLKFDSLKKRGNSISRQNSQSRGNIRGFTDAISISGRSDSDSSSAGYVRKNRDTGSKSSGMSGASEQRGGFSYSIGQSTGSKGERKESTGTYHNRKSESKINTIKENFQKRGQSLGDRKRGLSHIKPDGGNRRNSRLITILLILLVLIAGGVAIGTVLSKNDEAKRRARVQASVARIRKMEEERKSSQEAAEKDVSEKDVKSDEESGTSDNSETENAEKESKGSGPSDSARRSNKSGTNSGFVLIGEEDEEKPADRDSDSDNSQSDSNENDSGSNHEPEAVSGSVMLMNGIDFSEKLYSLTGDGLNCESFKKSDHEPSSDNKKEENEINLFGSQKKVYMWVEGSDVLWWSNASTVYLNEDSFGMFTCITGLKYLSLEGFDSSKLEDCTCMFSYLDSLTELKLGNLDTSNVESMVGMFEGCSSLTSLDLSTMDMSKVISFDYMFSDCTSLRELKIDQTDFHNVLFMDEMFSNCPSLTFDCSGWTVSADVEHEDFAKNSPGVTSPNWH